MNWQSSGQYKNDRQYQNLESQKYQRNQPLEPGLMGLLKALLNFFRRLLRSIS